MPIALRKTNWPRCRTLTMTWQSRSSSNARSRASRICTRFSSANRSSPNNSGELYGKLFVHINLNHAARTEILLIPGVGNRLAHEFEEYRPYKSLAQFRREIGNYVDEKEVARLERFITLE